MDKDRWDQMSEDEKLRWLAVDPSAFWAWIDGCDHVSDVPKYTLTHSDKRMLVGMHIKP
jgi:hypothetical protein